MPIVPRVRSEGGTWERLDSLNRPTRWPHFVNGWGLGSLRPRSWEERRRQQLKKTRCFLCGSNRPSLPPCNFYFYPPPPPPPRSRTPAPSPPPFPLSSFSHLMSMLLVLELIVLLGFWTTTGATVLVHLHHRWDTIFLFCGVISGGGDTELTRALIVSNSRLMYRGITSGRGFGRGGKGVLSLCMAVVVWP